MLPEQQLQVASRSVMLSPINNAPSFSNTRYSFSAIDSIKDTS
jgi:hypothetical protein